MATLHNNVVPASGSAGAGVWYGDRGVFAGGWSPTTNTIDYVTISTPGNATDFGNLTSGRSNFTGLSNSVRGVFAGGQS